MVRTARLDEHLEAARRAGDIPVLQGLLAEQMSLLRAIA
jgi:hypothetical protein